MPNFRLRLPENDIGYWAERYKFDTDKRPKKVGAFARKQGYLDVANLFAICHWKSSRSAKWARKNSESSVKEITRFSFSTPDRYARIASLTLLRGVGWPTASVILHFCVSERYPILDRRAIWSLHEKPPSQYDFDYWSEYIAACRAIADRNKFKIRQLDKALWQFSKENQPKIG